MKLERPKLVSINELSKEARIKRIVNIVVEGAMVLVAMAYGIYFNMIGDPNNRIMSCVGLGVAFMMPLLVELILGRRFTFMQHIVLELYLLFTMYLGSVLYLHHSFAPFDEISHVIFGYFSSLVIFIGFIYSKALVSKKAVSANFIIFLIGMGVAALWEIAEFGADIFLGENSLGFPPQELLKYIEENGITGIEANIMSLRYTSVIDTVTDMIFHVIGGAVFSAQFLIHKLGKRNMWLGSLEKEIADNEMNTIDRK